MGIRGKLLSLMGKRPATQSQRIYSIIQESELGKQKATIPRAVPLHVPRPEYVDWNNNMSHHGRQPSECITDDDMPRMRRACRLAADVLASVKTVISPGVTTNEIDLHVHNKIVENGAYPSPLGYQSFPKSVCTSVNNVICHGIPDDRPLQDGDLLNVDVTCFLDGFHGDNSQTFVVGSIDDAGQRLVDVALECLYRGIEVCGPGVPLRSIGSTIEDHATSAGFTISKAFVGHGIGSQFHCSPHILHYNNYNDGVMEPGMVFTIEPCVNEYSEHHLISERDGWTALTVDQGRSAQNEHTILISEEGYEILTIPTDGTTEPGTNS